MTVLDMHFCSACGKALQRSNSTAAPATTSRANSPQAEAREVEPRRVLHPIPLGPGDARGGALHQVELKGVARGAGAVREGEVVERSRKAHEVARPHRQRLEAAARPRPAVSAGAAGCAREG